MTRIFISHSHSDEAIAYKLVNFLLAALRLEEEDILCTSNPDQGLSYSSSSITDQLKEQLKNSEALIVLITADSLHSAWIPFEAGSFWTTDKPIIPILGPGLTQNDLPGPLKSFLSIPIAVQDAEDKLNNATNQLAKNLNLQQEVTRRRNYTFQEFSDALRAWQSKRPVIDPTQQKEIQELTKKLKESSELIQQLESKERSHNKQLKESERVHNKLLEEMKTTSRQDKEKLKQSLQSEINRLQQQLDQARSQNEIDQNEIMRLQEKLRQQESFPKTTLKNFNFEVLTVNERGEEVKREKGQAQYFTEELGNGIAIDMVAIPGGKFLMGTEDKEIERLVKKFDWEGFRREKLRHEVTVQSFFMGKYPVTQGQWKAVASLPKLKRDLEADPSQFKGGNRPVERVSWEDAVEFCQRLSKQTGKEYRLPTEAEWEYACRAETTTPFHFGETITDKLANYDASKTYASESKGEYRKETTTVGIFVPNAFGLYDVHGQVWEWCEDDFYENYGGAPIDGKAWISRAGSKKVIRGGSWDDGPAFSRSACRGFDARGDRRSFIGLRVVCVAPSTT